MALSIIFFPTVLTNSISVMVLPEISEADSRNDTDRIKKSIRLTIFGSLLLGSLCTFGFLIFGKWIGDVLFGNALAWKIYLYVKFYLPVSVPIVHSFKYPAWTRYAGLSVFIKSARQFCQDLFCLCPDSHLRTRCISDGNVGKPDLNGRAFGFYLVETKAGFYSGKGGSRLSDCKLAQSRVCFVVVRK